MPRYTFSSVKTGERVEFDLPMKEAPPVGTVVKRNGKDYVRVVDRVQTRTPATRSFVSHSLPRNYKHHADAGGKFNEQGKPVFDSMRQVRETSARSQGEEPERGYAYD
jgi:hypothetical protein